MSRELAIRTQIARPDAPAGNGGGLPPGYDLAVLGRNELYQGKLDGFELQVLLSARLDQMLARESRETGKSRGAILGYLIDLSLYQQQ